MPTVGTPLLLVLDARFHSKHKRIPGNTQSYVTHPPGTNFRADVLRNTEGTQNDNGGVVGSISWRPFHRRVAWRLHLLSPSPRKSGSKFVVRGCGIMRVARYLRLLSMPCTAELSAVALFTSLVYLVPVQLLPKYQLPCNIGHMPGVTYSYEQSNRIRDCYRYMYVRIRSRYS